MGKKDFLTRVGAGKFLTGEKIFSEVPSRFFLEGVNELLQELPEGESPLTLKVQFFCALRASEKYPLFIKWFDDQSLEDQLAFFLPKKQLDIGCFGLVESWWAETPNQKRRRLIFIAEGLAGSYQGIELHIPQLSIVERLRDLNNECIVSGTGGGEYHHKIIAII